MAREPAAALPGRAVAPPARGTDPHAAVALPRRAPRARSAPHGLAPQGLREGRSSAYGRLGVFTVSTAVPSLAVATHSS